MGPFLKKYGAAATINFPLYTTDGKNLKIDAAFAAGDVKIMKNEGAEADTTNLPTDEGQGYSLALTATEMQAARIAVYLVDQDATKTWLDEAIVIETYGHASSEHEFDLDAALTPGNVADQVWDEARSGHVASGTFGEGIHDIRAPLRNTTKADRTTGNLIATNDDGTTRFTRQIQEIDGNTQGIVRL